MCCRARLADDWSEIKIRLNFDNDAPAPNYEYNHNLAPTERMMTAIRTEDGKRTPRMMKWGLNPSWAKDTKLQLSTINARSEEFTTKPAFKDAWKRGQRCLCVMTNFYEWKKLDEKGKENQSYAIFMADRKPMVMAGLWSTWRDPLNGEEVMSCTILTCVPNNAVATFTIACPASWAKAIGQNGSVKNRRITTNCWRC